MKQLIELGTTSKMVTVFIQNATSTVGAGLTGLTNSSSGLTWYWFAEDSTSDNSVTLATMTLGTWASGGFVQIDATHLPGFYEIGLPNAITTNTTTSRSWAVMMLQGAANMVPVAVEIQFTGWNPGGGDLPANVQQWLGTAVTSNAGTPIVYATNTMPANVVQWLGTAVTSAAGVPITTNTSTVTATVPSLSTNVNVTEWLGTAPNALVAGKVDAIPVILSGTATGGSSNTILITNGNTTSGYFNGLWVTILSGTGSNQTRLITGYSGGSGTQTATIQPNWVATPGTNSVFVLTPQAGVDMESVFTGTLTSSYLPANTVQWNSEGVNQTQNGYPAVDVWFWKGTAQTPDVGGIPVVDVKYWKGEAVPTPNVTGEPIVDIADWLGTAVTSNAGVPIVDVNGTITATVPTLSTNVNVTEWLGTAVTSNAGVPLVDVNSITGTVTATVVGGTISTVTGTVGSVSSPVTLATGQLTVKRNTALNGFTFPMYNGTTGSLQTGLTVSCMLSINGGSLQASTNNPTEIGSGIYQLNLAAADLDGTTIILVFTAAAASATVISLITQA